MPALESYVTSPQYEACPRPAVIGADGAVLEQHCYSELPGVFTNAQPQLLNSAGDIAPIIDDALNPARRASRATLP